jgi:hypothetical protein
MFSNTAESGGQQRHTEGTRSAEKSEHHLHQGSEGFFRVLESKNVPPMASIEQRKIEEAAAGQRDSSNSSSGEDEFDEEVIGPLESALPKSPHGTLDPSAFLEGLGPPPSPGSFPLARPHTHTHTHTGHCRGASLTSRSCSSSFCCS